jgi:hypothetical protein
MANLKILPSQLTYEELMLAFEDAAEVEEVISEEQDEDVVPFLSNYGVQPGNHPVSKKLLYNLYKEYSKLPLSQTTFNLRVLDFVPQQKIMGIPYYCLNQDNFVISKHIFKEQKTREKTKSLTYQKHFQWFLEGRQVKSGSKWVEGYILFFIYKDFCKSRRVNPKLGYENYHKFLKLHFEHKRLKGNRSLWFKVDTQTFELLPESEKEVIRESRKKSSKKGRSQKEIKQQESITTET